MTGIAIIGAGATPIDRWQAKTGRLDLDLLDEAVALALSEARVSAAQVEALSFTSPGPGTAQRLFSAYATARLGFTAAGKVVESGTGGWIGGLAFDAAASEIAFAAASRALRRCLPQAGLPAEKYETWKEIEFEFDYSADRVR